MSDEDTGSELTIEQRYPHSVEAVFEAWSDPSRVRAWWGPKDFTATEFEHSFIVGGPWRAVIVGPDERPLNQSGHYTRIEPGRLIAFTFRWDDGDSPQTDITVEFAADGDDTVVTFHQAPFSSDESRRSHQEGWRECLEHLGNYLNGAAE